MEEKRAREYKWGRRAGLRDWRSGYTDRERERERLTD